MNIIKKTIFFQIFPEYLSFIIKYDCFLRVNVSYIGLQAGT